MQDTPTLPVIQLREVRRSYGSFLAVDGISLNVPPGAILGIIGPSGSGKTTLIRMMTGTLQPSGGELRVLGDDPLRFHRRTREQIGYMPQHFVLYPDLTVAENVGFMAALFGLGWRRRGRRVREVLQMVDLWNERKRRGAHLSGGMQRRVQLAAALVHDPRLILVDEPTAGLDPVLRQRIWEHFRQLRDRGRTLLVTTQYVGEAEYCDTVAVLAEGRLIALAPPDQLRRDALGGEMLQVETADPYDGQLLRGVAGVRSVRQTSPRSLLVVTEDAGATTPRVLEAIQSQGTRVVASSEYHPSFDEVFAELVDRRGRDELARPGEVEESSDVRRAA